MGILFKEKKFGLRNLASRAKDLYQKDPTKALAIGVSTTGLGVSATNLAVNSKRHKEATMYQKEQLKAMNRLTDKLGNVTNSMEKMSDTMGSYQDALSRYQNSSLSALKKKAIEKKEQQESKKRKSIFDRFFSENNSNTIIKNTLNGSWVGGTLATVGAAAGATKLLNSSGLSLVGKGLIIGAALGALVGYVKTKSADVARNSVGDKNLMHTVLDNLKKTGFKEGKDFVRSPKEANMLKTKVCVVITRVNGDLKLLVNSARDPKLQRVINEIHIPNTSVTTTNTSDRYNDITISAISDGSADAGLVTGLCEYFIRSGFPVYLIEVN